MTLDYQGQTYTVETTGNASEPYRLIGARGRVLTLVARQTARPTFWVRLPNGKIQGGYVGLLRDGSLLWLPTSGPLAFAHERRYRAERADAA